MRTLTTLGVGLAVGAVTVDALAGGQQLTGQGGWLLGFIATNRDPAAAAEIALFDGADANGQLLMRLAVGAKSTVHAGPSLPGWPLDGGLFALVTAGALTFTATIGQSA